MDYKLRCVKSKWQVVDTTGKLRAEFKTRTAAVDYIVCLVQSNEAAWNKRITPREYIIAQLDWFKK